MNFNEKHHAYISALYYKVLSQGGYRNYKNTFLIATRKTAEERGHRMALRAIRDGVEVLDYAAYRYYGEWAFTEFYLTSLDGQRLIEPIKSDKDYAYTVYHCPWAEVYHELDISDDGGLLYCQEIDASIIRGFNPGLNFLVTQTLQNTNKCMQYQIDGNTESKNVFGEKDPRNIKGFDYQCGHIYIVFSQIVMQVYPDDGVSINKSVIEAFRWKFGTEMANKLLSYNPTDFAMI